MTPQEHIDAIGAALKQLEDAIAAQEETLAEAKRCARILHKKLNRAQKAYAERHDDDNVIQLFSTDDGTPGGTSKPDDEDPDKPVEP